MALPAIGLCVIVHLLARGPSGEEPNRGPSGEEPNWGPPPSRRGIRLLRLAVGLALVPLAWAAVFLYYALRGETAALVEGAITYNQAYVQPLLVTLRHALGWPDVGFLAAAAAPPTIGLLLSRREAGERRHGWALLLALVAGTWVAVSLPGHFYLHYYQYWLPVLCLSVAVGWDLLRRLPTRAATRLAHSFALVILLAVLAAHRVPFTRWTPEDWSRAKYGEQLIEARRWGRRIGELLRPTETMWTLGSDPSLYLYAGKRPPTRLLVDYPWALINRREERFRALGQRLLEESAEQLASARPDLVAARAGHVLLAAEVVEHNPISAVLADGYLRLAMPSSAPWVLLIHRDSPLRRRVPATALRPPMEPLGTWRPPTERAAPAASPPTAPEGGASGGIR